MEGHFLFKAPAAIRMLMTRPKSTFLACIGGKTKCVRLSGGDNRTNGLRVNEFGAERV